MQVVGVSKYPKDILIIQILQCTLHITISEIQRKIIQDDLILVFYVRIAKLSTTGMHDLKFQIVNYKGINCKDFHNYG